MSILNEIQEQLQKGKAKLVAAQVEEALAAGVAPQEIMEALHDVVKSGKALYAGISNYNPDQARRAIKCMKDMGMHVSNGTDCPVELPFAMGGIQCAVTRTDLKGSVSAYLPDEAFTVQEALDSFTHDSAYASFEEHRKGKIQPGQLADFVVLEQNPFAVSTSQLSGISLLQTFLGGRNVYKKS